MTMEQFINAYLSSDQALCISFQQIDLNINKELACKNFSIILLIFIEGKDMILNDKQMSCCSSFIEESLI
jgi:hypothetical protein